MPPNRNDDIIFQADVDDKTIEFFERFDRNLDRIADTAEDGFSRVERSANRSGKEIGLVAGVVASLNAKLLELAFKGGAAFKNFIVSSTQLRARVDVLGTTLNLVGQRAGKSAEEIQLVEEELKGLGITTQAARTSLIRLARANIDWSEAAKLARIAQNSAVVAGINSSQAFERLIRGIQKQEPELLDELGIQLRRTVAYKTLADEIGKTTKELTDAERQTAILNEIYRQSEVVTGAYEAAMGNVGKQVTSLPRHIEELQLAIGGAFQPAHALQVEFMTNKLKELRQWVEDNKDEIEEFGIVVVKSLKIAIDMLEKVIGFTAKIPGFVKNAGVSLAKLLSDMDDADVEQQAKMNVTAERFGQFASIFIGVVKAIAVSVSESVGIAIDGINGIMDLVNAFENRNEASISKAAKSYEDFTNRVDNFGNTVTDAFESGTIGAGEFFGIIEAEAEDAVNELDSVADSFGDLTDSIVDSSAAMDQASSVLGDLFERTEEATAERQIQEMRRLVEAQLRTSFRIQDIERNHQERLARLREDGEERRQDLAERGEDAILILHEERNDRALQIEEDFQNKLRDIQEKFERDASELARSRDAIGLLRLMRNKKVEIEQEQKRADERRKQNDSNFNKRLTELRKSLEDQERTLQESLDKQAQAIESQRVKEFEALERQLDRQKQVRELHNQFAEEDRQRAFEKELRDIAKQFSDIEGLTADGLDNVLAEWEEHFGDLSELRNEFLQLQVELAELSTLNIPGIIRTAPGRTLPGGLDPGTLAPGEELGHGGGIFGQGGQLSRQLASVGSMQSTMQPQAFMPQVPRLQPTRPQRTLDRKEIHVTADGLDPIIQRQVIAVLTEIERNRG